MSGVTTTFSNSYIGKSHEVVGRVCQDFSMSLSNDRYDLAVISDGHGSAPHFRSDRGARFACESVRLCTDSFFSETAELTDIAAFFNTAAVWQFLKRIVLTWNEAVTEDFESNPFTQEELSSLSPSLAKAYGEGKNYPRAYGCTLCFALVTDEFILLARNGDGDITLMDQDGNFSNPVEWNEKCEANRTTSLCEENTIDEFRFTLLNHIPAAIFVSSDGVANSYPDAESLNRFYKAICRNALKKGFDKIEESLQAFLPTLTERGSGDDVSIAGILNQVLLSDMSAFFTEASAPKSEGSEPEVSNQDTPKRETDTSADVAANSDAANSEAVFSAVSASETAPTPEATMFSQRLQRLIRHFRKK